MKKIFVLIFLIFLTYSQKGATKNELDQKLQQFNMSPLVSLLLVFDSSSPRAELLQTLINSIAQKRKGYFNVITVDCNTKDKDVLQTFVYCNEQYRKQLPALVFSDPSLNTQSQQKGALSGIKPYQGPLDDKSLFNFAVPLMKIYSLELKTSRDLKKFEQSYPGVPKIVFFTDRQKKQKIPPLYRALTAHFRNNIAFGHVFQTSPLVKDLQIKSFPIFLLNGKQKIEVKSNLHQIIERFEVLKGEPTNIFIKQLQGSNKVQLTADNLQQLVYKTPQHILIHVLGQDGRDHPEWANLTQKFNKMFQFYQTFTLKQTLGVKQTPSLVYFPKSIAKKAVQKTIFSAKDAFTDIYNQLDSLIEDFSLPIANYLELQKLTSVHLQDEKFVAIYFHIKQIPISYKVVSNDLKLQQQIAFFRMRDPQTQILQQYQIKKLPSLIVMIMDKQSKSENTLTQKEKKEGKQQMQLKLATYQGKFSYVDLQKFFQTFVRSQKNIPIKQQENQREESNINSLQQIKQIKKSNKLKNKCQQGCFMLLINGNPQNKQKNNEYLSVFQKQTKRIIAGNYGYIDGACHSEVINSFEILEDELPTLIYIEPKFQKYARMVGRVEPSSVATFITKIKVKKGMFRGYNKLQFQNKDCEFQHEKLKKLDQNNNVMSQEQTQIIEELRANDQKKRQQFEQAQKDDKIRKKGKKKRPKKEWQQNEQL